MKKCVSVFLCILLLFSIFSVNADEAATEQRGYLPPETISSPISNISIQSYATNTVNGTNYAYVATNNGYFHVYNMDKREMEKTFKVNNMTTVWTHFIDSQGLVYYGGDGYISMYNPYNGKLSNLGQICEQWCIMACEDDNRNIYFGTYPSAKLIRYNAETGVVTDLGRLDDQGKYANNLAYYNGHVYVSVQTEKEDYMMKVSTENPTDRKRIDYPDWESYNFSGRSYYRVVRDKMFINAHEEKLVIFDLAKEEFLRPETNGMGFTGYCSSEKDGKIYLALYDYGRKGSELHSYDLESGVLTPLGIYYSTAYYLDGGQNSWRNISADTDPEIAGDCMVGIRNGNMYLWNPEKGAVKVWKNIGLKGTGISLMELGKTPEGELYIGGFRDRQVARFDTESQEIFPNIRAGGQTETFVFADGKMYIGGYPSTPIYVHEVGSDADAKVISANLNNDIESAITFDRIQNMVAGDGKVFFSAFPYLDQNGCGFGWIDTATDKIAKYVDQPIKNQTISAMEYRNGLLYIGTSVRGGSSTTPVDSECHLMVYDVAAEQMTNDFVLRDAGQGFINVRSLKFDSRGRLLALLGTALYTVDCENRTVAKVCDFATEADTQVAPAELYRRVYMEIEDNLLYVCANNKMRIVNLDDFTQTNIASLSNLLLAYYRIGNDGNFYYLQGDSLKRIKFCDFAVDDAMIEGVKSGFSDKILMHIGKSLTYSLGNPKQIDSENPSIVPFTENDRTMLPVRFVAESLGLTVSWDDASQTATLKNRENEIKITVDQATMLVNGESKALDSPAIVRDGRTYLPLRAIAAALSKEVFWDDRGIIVISDEIYQPEENERIIADAYIGYMIDDDYANSIYFTEREEAIRNSGGEVLYENEYEKKVRFRIDPTPGVTRLYEQNGKDIKIEFSEEMAFGGVQSLHLYNETAGVSTRWIGTETGLFESKGKKNFNVYFKLYSLDGAYIHYMFETYDENKNLLNTAKKTINLTNGIWQDFALNFYVPDKKVKYINLKVFDHGCYTIDAYMDSLLISGE